MYYPDRKEFVAKLKKRLLTFSVEIIRFVDTLPKDSSSQIIGRQLIRSATSIGANFIEAQAASSTKDFINFLSIALKSANETAYWLEVFREAKKSNPQRLEHYYLKQWS